MLATHGAFQTIGPFSGPTLNEQDSNHEPPFGFVMGPAINNNPGGHPPTHMDANNLRLGDDSDMFLQFTDAFSPVNGFMSMDLSLGFPAANDEASAVSTLADRSLFPYFLEHVEPPFISPCDGANWKRMRRYIAGLGCHSSVVAAAISSIEALCEAEKNG